MRLGIALCLLGGAFAIAPAAAGAIAEVAITPSFFNPSLGQKQGIQFKVVRPGTVTVDILDRDRYLIRSWNMAVSAGPVTATWDGRDNGGAVVPDEAYYLRLRLLDESGAAEVYDPSASFQPQSSSPRADFFSRDTGILGYTLATPSRVHVQAGESRQDPRSGKPAGAVLKTLVDNLPRVSGPVIEKWNGLDESGTIPVASLPDFVVAIFATPLPPASMIAIGNRETSFFDYAIAHRPPDATRPRDLRSSHQHHHHGVTALEDQTPPLLIEVSGTWDASARRWQVSPPLQAKLTVGGKGAPYFLTQRTQLSVFVDGLKVREIAQPTNPTTVSFSRAELPTGPHRIAFNWGSSMGPTAVNAFAVDVAGSPGAHKGGR